MYSSADCRWLPALVLLVALPAAPQDSGAQWAGHSEAESSAYLPASAGDSTSNPVLAPSPSLEETGSMHYVNGEYQAAIRAYKQIAQPSAIDLNIMGICYQMLYDFTDAEISYTKSLKLQPDSPTVLNNLATVQDMLQDYRRAEQNFRLALKLEPHSALVLKNLGTNLLLQQEFGKGNEAYKEALAIDPHIFDAHPGPHARALCPLKTVSALNYAKARACAVAGETNCAIAYLQKAFNEGSATVDRVSADEGFASLRGTPAFARLLAEQQ